MKNEKELTDVLTYPFSKRLMNIFKKKNFFWSCVFKNNKRKRIEMAKGGKEKEKNGKGTGKKDRTGKGRKKKIEKKEDYLCIDWSIRL